MEKKRARKIVACLMAVLLALMMRAAPVLWIGSYTSGFYTDSQHLARIQRRAEDHFLWEGGEHTSLEVYPIYNQDDELKYALIEMQPEGYMYVKINRGSIISSLLFRRSMYTMARDRTYSTDSWRPYRVIAEPATGIYGDYTAYIKENILNEDGTAIVYYKSQFRVMGIENERRYFLETPRSENSTSSPNLIPAVKRGAQWLNVMDGTLFDYDPEKYEPLFPVVDGYFIPDNFYDL